MIKADLLIKILLSVIAGIIGVGSFFFGKYKGHQDNPIEEASEKIIELEVGADIDLSPLTPEKKEGE